MPAQELRPVVPPSLTPSLFSGLGTFSLAGLGENRVAFSVL